MKTLAKVHAFWKEHCTCELRHSTREVCGDGNPHAEVVFIGEAPGKKEEETGVPFVGAAGKFLSEMLESIQMKREHIYITNIVKYRPPNNRDPLPEEKDACREWLHQELNTIAPAHYNKGDHQKSEINAAHQPDRVREVDVSDSKN